MKKKDHKLLESMIRRGMNCWKTQRGDHNPVAITTEWSISCPQNDRVEHNLQKNIMCWSISYRLS